MIDVSKELDLDTDCPTKDMLWDSIERAYSYLHEWVNDSSSREHATKGYIQFDVSTYGTQSIIGGRLACRVCLAGLLYLQEQGRLLTEEKTLLKAPTIANDIDCLRYPYSFADRVMEYLGVSGTYTPDNPDLISMWDTRNPDHILDYLSWLLKQRHTLSVL